MFKEIDKYNLAMIEQPLMYDDLIDHAFLQDKIKTPVCLDESITSPQKALKAEQIKACKYVNIKPGRVGGLTKALEIHDVCEKNNIPCWVGGMLESSIGANHCIALATKRNIKYPSDIFPTQRFYKKDIGVPEIKLCGPSQIKANGSPGIGAIPDDILLRKYAIEHITIR
jgi:O-succinylbenzoate synthase